MDRIQQMVNAYVTAQYQTLENIRVYLNAFAPQPRRPRSPRTDAAFFTDKLNGPDSEFEAAFHLRKQVGSFSLVL